MIHVGAASKVINNELGTPIQGASVDKVARSIRDDLEANALLLRDHDTNEHVLLISCDLAGLLPERAAKARAAIADATGLDPHRIIIACTHMHSGPSIIATNVLKPIDSAYLDRLHHWLVELARDAAESAVPGRLGWGVGSVRIGYNRRCCWADGSHSMHGDTSRPDFTGLEGADDPQHTALFAEDAEGRLLGIVHHNTSHPTCFYGADFYSADFPGAARTFLRETLGPVPVLFLNGAFGDISISSQLASRSNGEMREQRMLRAAHLVTGETLRLLHQAQFHDTLQLRHVRDELELPVRLPAPERVEWARETLAKVETDPASVQSWERMRAYGTSLLHEHFHKRPVDTLPLHALRLGGLGIATQPCELYCRFGLDIKRRSPAAATAVVGIADGYHGYCPDTAGIIGGGYSGEPFEWCRLAPEAGYRIVDTASRLLHQLWRA